MSIKRLLISVALLAGCATQEPISSAEDWEAREPLVCRGKDQCDRWWRRAQVWISENSGFRIQVATDGIIETYGPPAYSTRWAFRAVREPSANEVERMRIAASCGPAPLCRQNPLKLIAQFKRYVRQE